jgi:hypothetical protein
MAFLKDELESDEIIEKRWKPFGAFFQVTDTNIYPSNDLSDHCHQGDQMRLLKSRPKCSPTHFCQNYYIVFLVVKSSKKFVSTFVIYKKN